MWLVVVVLVVLLIAFALPFGVVRLAVALSPPAPFEGAAESLIEHAHDGTPPVVGPDRPGAPAWDPIAEAQPDHLELAGR